MVDDADGRYLVIDGRRWRASDPSIPEALRRQLVGELMAARRAVAAGRGDDEAVAAARRRVQDAKVALGERGHPWWEPSPPEARQARSRATARALLRHRDPERTICPSDVARVVASPQWRAAMDEVRAVGSGLAGQGRATIRQRGEIVPVGTETRGPLRYGRGPTFPDPPEAPGPA